MRKKPDSGTQRIPVRWGQTRTRLSDCFYWLSGLPSKGTAVPQRKIPFVMPGQWLVNENLRANAAEVNTVQTDCRVWWRTWPSFCYSLCWGQRYLVTSDGWLKAPFYISSSFFLFSPVGAGGRNVEVIGRSQTWSYRGHPEDKRWWINEWWLFILWTVKLTTSLGDEKHNGNSLGLKPSSVGSILGCVSYLTSLSQFIICKIIATIVPTSHRPAVRS